MFQFRSPFRGLRSDSQREIIRERLLELKNIGDEECRGINAMSRIEVFEYIQNISKRSLDRFWWWHLMCTFHTATEPNDASGIVDTIKTILMCIKSRLEGTADIDHMLYVLSYECNTKIFLVR